MKKLKMFLILTLFLILFIPFRINAEENEIRLYLFHSSSCPHCKAEIEFLESIKDDYPSLKVITYEVSENEMNYNFYNKVLKKTGINATGVPFTLIGTDYYVGFDENTGTDKEIKKSIEKFLNGDYVDVIAKIKNDEDISDIKYNVDSSSEKEIPILGIIDSKSVSLPILSIVMGALDGFNPCAMWVLLFLITMLFNMKDKKKMWILGLTFLTTSALVYLFIMLAWLKVAISFTTVKWIRVLIALVALCGGIVNLNGFRKSIQNKTDGCEVVDDKKRKKTFKKIKDIVNEKKFILALVGVITLSVSVNFIELACSAGLPLIFTQVLALNNLSTLEYSIYMLLYILFFLLDDIVVFVIAMITLNVKGISSKYGKYSHLVGGIIMALIAVLMLFKPEWLMFNFK